MDPTARRASRALRLITRESARDGKGNYPLAPPYALPVAGFAQQVAGPLGIAPGLYKPFKHTLKYKKLHFLSLTL